MFAVPHASTEVRLALLQTFICLRNLKRRMVNLGRGFQAREQVFCGSLMRLWRGRYEGGAVSDPPLRLGPMNVNVSDTPSIDFTHRSTRNTPLCHINCSLSKPSSCSPRYGSRPVNATCLRRERSRQQVAPCKLRGEGDTTTGLTFTSALGTHGP